MGSAGVCVSAVVPPGPAEGGERPSPRLQRGPRFGPAAQHHQPLDSGAPTHTPHTRHTHTHTREQERSTGETSESTGNPPPPHTQTHIHKYSMYVINTYLHCQLVKIMNLINYNREFQLITISHIFKVPELVLIFL